MPTDAVVFALPQTVADELPDAELLVDESAARFLTTATDRLAAYLCELYSSLEMLALFRELGLKAGYGLAPADPALWTDGEAPSRPPLFGLSADTVGRSARLAFERAVLWSDFGTRVPRASDIEEIILVSTTHMQLDMLREISTLRVDPLQPGMGRVQVGKSGRSVFVGYVPEDFDLFGYQRMREHRLLDADPQDSLLLEAFHLGVPPELQELSDAMLTDLGFDAEDLINCLVWGTRVALNEGYESLGLRLDEYRALLGAMSDRALVAFDHLTFSADHLGVEDLRTSATRHQRRRSVTHPFIVHREYLFLVRDLLFEAMQRWMRYLQNGDWPVPVSARSEWPTLARAIEKRRVSRGTGAFEPFVEACIEQTGLPWGSTSGAHAVIGGATITGETDALVVDVATATLWVIEAKDVSSDQNLRSLQTELRQMRDKYGPQVQRAVTDIAVDAPAVARHIVHTWSKDHGTIEETAAVKAAVAGIESWTVRPLIVVRDRSAGEFLVGRTWDITPVSGLAGILIGTVATD